MAPNTKINKACKTMKNLGYSEKIIKPVLKELLKLYEKDWTFIEEDNYQVLLDAILESEEQKSLNNELEHQNTEDEVEENEPPLKRSKLSSQKNQSSTSFQPEMNPMAGKIEMNPYLGSTKMRILNQTHHVSPSIVVEKGREEVLKCLLK